MRKGYIFQREFQNAGRKTTDDVDSEMAGGALSVVGMVFSKISTHEVQYCQPQNTVAKFCMKNIQIRYAGQD